MQALTTLVFAALLLIWPLAPCLAAEAEATQIEEPEFGGSLYLLETGKEHHDSVVLVHGLGNAGTQDWKNVIPVLAKHFHVIAPDLPGFAASGKGNHLYSPTRYARLLKWIIDRCCSGRYRGGVMMVGHSMGGAIALRYAATYPGTLEKLVLVDAAGILHRSAFAVASLKNMPDHSDLLAMFGSNPEEAETLLGDLIVASESFPAPVDTILNSSYLRGFVLRKNPSVIASLALLQEDFGPAIDRVEIPTAIIWGEDDRVAPPRTGRLLSMRLSHASLDLLAGVGHVPMNEARKRFNSLLLARLTKPLPLKSGKTVKPGTKSVVCNSRNEMHLTGAYRDITINNCKDVVMENVAAESIRIENSEVSIYGATLKSEGKGMVVKNSTLMATALDIEAETAIDAYDSKLDLAGADIRCEKFAVGFAGGDKSTVLFSISKIGGEYVHSAFRIGGPADAIPCRLTGE